jgi:hypothetical protein
MRDPEDVGSWLWLLMILGGLLALTVIGGLAFAIAGELQSASDKRERRRTGHRVVEDERREWYCAPLTPERP